MHAYLADFGLAKVLTESGTITRGGSRNEEKGGHTLAYSRRKRAERAERTN